MYEFWESAVAVASLPLHGGHGLPLCLAALVALRRIPAVLLRALGGDCRTRRALLPHARHDAHHVLLALAVAVSQVY